MKNVETNVKFSESYKSTYDEFMKQETKVLKKDSEISWLINPFDSFDFEIFNKLKETTYSLLMNFKCEECRYGFKT